jgi:tetratricopeptide (TPR) repeat protein
MKAAETYGDLFAQDPGITLPQLRFSYGKALFAIDRNQDALTQLELALSGPVAIRAEALLYMGQIYARQGDLDRAKEYFAVVRQIDPQLWGRYEPSLRNAGFLRDIERPSR